MQKYNTATETIKLNKSNIDKLNDESNAKLAMLSQLNKKIKENDKDHDTTKKKAKTDLDAKTKEIKEIKEELTRLNCEKGMITVSLKSKDDSLKKTIDEVTKLKDEITNLKSKLENTVNVNQSHTNNSLSINPVISHSSPTKSFNNKHLLNMNAFSNMNNTIEMKKDTQMSKEMSELDFQRKAKSAMANKLMNNNNNSSKGFDLPQSLRMGSSFNDKFKHRNINKTE